MQGNGEHYFCRCRVQAQLKNTLLLQIDLTANNDDDKAVLQRYAIFGPPAILFFDKQGKEQADFRVMGYQGPQQFLAWIGNALK